MEKGKEEEEEKKSEECNWVGPFVDGVGWGINQNKMMEF
jgi:hypothetical protein